ncbi:MAG TPA: glycosyltransferase family 39 protein [Acidobacteriaceae bacterium]|jgi:4-amino-4-deoxy-L-arabinose transferase-like glycosyltransferase|nr:glycosyltransferase family 39 protein [Acidobacteriaceae bacterium]
MIAGEGERVRAIPLWAVYASAFAAVLAAHAPLLRLPYYWDEAGYYIPAAFDFFRSGSLIPYSTLSNAHPPLPSLYLALVWKIFHFAPLVTRTAMCAVAALALTAVWRLAVMTTGKQAVALATVLLTAAYPVFFAQSSLAHADLFAAAATLWALVFLLEERIWIAALCFSLAALSKETAVVTPVALAVWESWRWRPKRIRTVAALLSPVLPLAGWYAWHWEKTGFVFGNPEYLRYNATATLTGERVLLALSYRAMHLLFNMNMFVPVALMLACMLLPPVAEDSAQRDVHAGPGSDTRRQRIAPAHQAVFIVTIAANLALFSALGGALLTRYLLPLYPLVLLLAVNTFRRRLREWTALVALSAAAFVVGLFVNPPYRFAPEDNLEYVTVIHLHQAAVAQVVAHYPEAKVLTAWPVSDELRKPELGYVTRAVPVVVIDNFTAEEIAKAAQRPESYSAAVVFSTKYDPPKLPFLFGRRSEGWDERYFDFHRDLLPGTIAQLLGGSVAWGEAHKGQWIAVLRFDRTPGAREALLANPSN